MGENAVSKRDQRWAQICVDCLMCKRARSRQKGFSYWFVKEIDTRICPFCKAYERVYGRKAYEPAPKKGRR